MIEAKMVAAVSVYLRRFLRRRLDRHLIPPGLRFLTGNGMPSVLSFAFIPESPSPC